MDWSARRRRDSTTGDPGAGRELSPGQVAALPPRFEAVGDALASGSGSVVACEVLGTRLARDGVSLAEALDDLGPVRHTHDLRDAIAGVDAIVLVTRWSLYTAEVPKLVGDDERAPVVIDGRRVIAPDSVPTYRGIGR